jgi:tRNA-dihydrouridine synthase
LFEETGCDAVMIGRAAQGNPWLFAQVDRALRGEAALPPPSLADRVRMAIEHGDLLIADKGRRVGVREMRKHISWYLKGFYGAAHFREEVMRLTDWEAVVALLRRVEHDESLALAINGTEADRCHAVACDYANLLDDGNRG